MSRAMPSTLPQDHVVTETAHGQTRYLVTVAEFTHDLAKASRFSQPAAERVRDYLRELYRADSGWAVYNSRRVTP